MRKWLPFPALYDTFKVRSISICSALETLDEANVDSDLWALLRWIIEGVGGEWRVEDLDATGRLYQLSAAGSG